MISTSIPLLTLSISDFLGQALNHCASTQVRPTLIASRGLMERYSIPESLDSTTRPLSSLVGDDDIAAVFEESQNRFSLPQQGVAQFTKATSTSRGVPNETKRSSDRAYRERLKRERKQMESDLLMVGQENEDLKRENGRLRLEKDLMDQGQQTRATENKRLKTEVCGLRGKISHQLVLVDAFSRKLLIRNHEDGQLLMLRQEIARHGNITWTDQMEEKKRLLDIKINLEHQNRVLKVQVQALCEKIYNDRNHQERQI